MTEQDYLRELAARDRVIQQQAALNEQLQAQVAQLESEVESLKQLLHTQGESKASKTPTFKENYSVDAHRKKQQRAKRKKSPGRRPKEAQRREAQKEIKVYPQGVARRRCVLVGDQLAWRLIDGKAVFICYQIYDLPESKSPPLPPGLRNSRSGFGLEILLVLAYLHYWVGVSLDRAIEIIHFFTGLELSKPQANSLLEQLADDWSDQHDTISELLAAQLVIYIDETGWKVGTIASYTWVFSAIGLVLYRCGVGRGKEEAEAVLGESFRGTGVSDDYSAYKNLFNKHQLCWAHLLRKAIKLALQHPDEEDYRTFLQELYDIYRTGIRYQKDKRLSTGRPVKVRELQERILELCDRAGSRVDKSLPQAEQQFLKLQNELVKGLEKLFVFVEQPEVEATNNVSERNGRREAEIRKGGRTSKTPEGARRRSIIITVLASLRTRFKKFSLSVMLSEVQRWWEQGYSIFESELQQLYEAIPPPQLAGSN